MRFNDNWNYFTGSLMHYIVCVTMHEGWICICVTSESNGEMFIFDRLVSESNGQEYLFNRLIEKVNGEYIFLTI